MQCLNIRNKEVAALLKEYTEILGDENAAYYVLSENNGYGLDKAPNGEPSKLYNDLLSIYNNDHSMAIRAKSMVYSDNFKNWFGDWIKVASSTEAAHKLTSYLNDLVNRKNRFSKLAKTLLDNGAIPYNLKYFKIDNNREDIEGHAGMWNSFANLIEVLGNNINQESIDKALLHELIHYNTEQLLQDYKNNKEIPADQKEAIKRLYDIIEYSKNYLSKELQTNRDKYLEIARRQSNTVSSRLFYAFDNNGSVEIDEFISEIFTNPGLQEVLNNIPYKKSKQSLWDKIKNAISSIFGFDINDGSVLEEALKESSKLIQNNSNVSKVVDNNGEPLVVYHHSNSPITEFSIDFDNYFSTLKGGTKKALFFTGTSIPKKGTVLDRKYKLPVYLKADRVIEKNGTKEELRNQGEDFVTTINRAAEEADAAIFHGIDDNQELNQDIYVINNPNNVKSVSNKGTFSTESNIVYEQRITTKEQRLLNFYNRYVKLRSKSAQPAEDIKEHRKRISKLSSRSKLHRTDVSQIIREFLGIDPDKLSISAYSDSEWYNDLDNLSKEDYLTALNEEIEQLKSKDTPISSLDAAIQNVIEGYAKASDYDGIIAELLNNMPKYEEATELPKNSRAKNLNQYNAYKKLQYQKKLDEFKSSARRVIYSIRARIYHLETIKSFIEEYEPGFNEMKLKVIDEYIYRNDYDSIKEPKLKKVYNALASLAKEQNEVDLQAAGEQVSEIKKIKTLKEAIDLLSEKMPQYSKILNYLKNIKFYEDVAITVADNLGNNTFSKVVGKNKFKINPETGEFSDTIIIGNDSYGYRTLLHEIIHTFTSLGLVARDVNGSKKFEKDINVIMEHCYKYIGNQKLFGILFQDNLNYGFTDPSEFVAEFFSNPAFQMLLKEIPAISETEVKEKNLFQSIIEAITRFFTNLIGNKESNLYDQIEPLMYNIIDFQTELYEQGTIRYNPNYEGDTTQINNQEIVNFENNQEVIDKTYEKLIKATEARLRIAVHSANKDGIQTEKLQNLLSNLNKLENDKAVIEFINYMADDVTSATALLRTYRSMFNDYKNGLSASNPINADMLDLIRKGTIGFYDALVTNLKNMLEDPDVMDLYKSLGVYDSMLARINDSLSKYNDLRRHFDNLSNAVAKDNLIAEAKRYGSFTVEELQRKLDEGDSDISFWDRFLGQTQYNSNESIRLMLNSIMIAKGAVYDRKLAKGKKLLELLSKIDKSRLPLFYERDKNGRRTGNFVRDLNFGQHEQDYMEHMLKLLDTFGVKVPSTMNFSDIPSILNPEQLKIWNKTKNEWDSKNTERKFTKEFYDLINNLSVDALAAKTQLDIDINSILDSTRDADGFAHKELLSKEKYEQYEKLMAAKRNLSNPFNMDGTAKTGKELEIAKEFQEYNKKLTKNIKYIANEDAFKKARAKAKRELTAEQFKLWEERNTVDKINEQFYEDLKKLSSVSQKSEKQEKYEYARQQLIRLYTVAGKPRIDDMPDRVKWLINTLDKLISTEAKRNADPGKKSRIMEIAEWEVNPEFYEQLNRMYYNSSPDAFRDWVNKNGYYNKDGQIVPASFWKRLVPRKEYADKYIDKVPDSSWIEMDKTSPYYNSNFDPSYGMSRVPKRSKYDNSANFNKLNKEEKALYDELFNTMIESNNMIVFKKHLNNGQLPQIEGGAWTLLNSQDTVLKGLGYMFKDRFAVKEDDPNAITDTTLDPDGTGIRLVPTRFMKKLDNPEALTNDLVGSIIAYYGMAVNFQEMSKIAPKMEMYLNMLANQEFKNWRGERIRGRESSTYAKAEEMIKQFVYGMEEQDSTININVSGKNVKINFNKILSDIAAFTRLNGMANNINVILTGLFTNKIQSRLDAISGIYYDNKALAKANKEVMLSYRHAIANIGNPNNKNKVLCALEWAGVVRDADTTFSKLNQSRWLRALNQHFWYGGYEIADYITKGKMAVAIMMSYKFDPETKKFVNKLTYMSRFKNKSEAEAKWDLLDTTAFDAFEMKDNMFTIKDEYVKYMDEVTANRIRNTIKQTGTRIDTQLTDLDKAYVSSNAYTKLLFIYRNFLLINLQTKFFTKRQYDYSTGMWQEAQYRGAFNYLWRHVLDKNKIKTLQEMYSNYDDLDEFERRLFKRSLYELIFSFVGLYVVSLVCKSLADDDPDNMFLQLMALVAVKVAIESRSNVSMIEATNMFTSPTAAWGIFQNFYKALTTIFDNPTEIIKSGAYKGKPRWFRSLVKITPFRAIYESKNFQEKRKYYDNMIAVF